MRAVERKVLLETLADQLPPESVYFNSKLTNISKSEGGETMLELVDGTRLSAKVRLKPLYNFLSNNSLYFMLLPMTAEAQNLFSRTLDNS